MPVSLIFGPVLRKLKYMKEITGKKFTLDTHNTNANSSYSVC